MPPAIIAAGIGAVASVGGGLLASSSSKKAANQAAQAQTDNTAANNALARELYGQNTANFQPYMATGQQAMGTLNGLLFGNQPQAQPQQAPPQQFNGGMPANGYNGGNALYGASGGFQQPFSMNGGIPNQNEPGYGLYGQDGIQPVEGGVMSQAPAQAPSGQNAWDTFRNSTNYQFRQNEGLNSLGTGWASQGAYRSGAAAKDAIRYNQNFASSELNNYMNLLQGQQNLGFGGAQALAGVSNNYSNNVTANNNNSADALSNAALLRGQASQNLYGGVGGALGTFASSFGGSQGKSGAASINNPWYVGGTQYGFGA